MDASTLPTTLLDVLSNSLILHQLAPHLSLASRLALCSLSRSFRALLQDAAIADVFRYVDFSQNASAMLEYAPVDTGGINWRSQRMDEGLTPDEFYSGPLLGLFFHLSKMHALEHVQTLVLDGLTVPTDVVHSIITESRFNVRTLSIREVKQLNEKRLMHVLDYAVRPSRPEGTPRLRCLYVFGAKDAVTAQKPSLITTRRRDVHAGLTDTGVMSAQGAQIGAQWNQWSQNAVSSSIREYGDTWYGKSGKVYKRTLHSSWGNTLRACEGIIAFDAILCRGPRHDVANTKHVKQGGTSYESWLSQPAIASVVLSSGCTNCGSSVEQAAIFDVSPSNHLPLLAPPPLLSSTIRAAQRPIAQSLAGYPQLFARCEDCLRGRWCERCHKWWCEDCYSPPPDGKRTSEVSDSAEVTPSAAGENNIKIHMGLCTEECLIGEMMSGAGSFGMWG